MKNFLDSGIKDELRDNQDPNNNTARAYQAGANQKTLKRDPQILTPLYLVNQIRESCLCTDQRPLQLLKKRLCQLIAQISSRSNEATLAGQTSIL